MRMVLYNEELMNEIGENVTGEMTGTNYCSSGRNMRLTDVRSLRRCHLFVRKYSRAEEEGPEVVEH
eukprot:9710498-Ditylum_brightwellii.AAC.1